MDENHPNKIVWKDFDLSENALDPETLIPAHEILDESIIVVDNDVETTEKDTTSRGPSPFMNAV